MQERLRLEIERRLKTDSYAAIGAELKSKRISQSNTLKAISDEICSVSYLSKIENNKIIPNKYYVKEMFSRLDLSDSYVEGLFELKTLILKCINAFIKDDNNRISAYYNGCEKFNNYRYKLIELIYYLSTKQMMLAGQTHEVLLDLLSGAMTDYDVASITVFSAIFDFLSFEFKTALKKLAMASQLSTDKDILLLCQLYSFYCSYATLDINTLTIYAQLKNTLFERGYSNILNKVNYVLALFYLKKKSYQNMNILLRNLNESYQNSLMFLKFFYTNKKYDGRRKLNKFCGDIIKAMNKKPVEFIFDEYYQLDYDRLLIEYLYLDGPNEKCDYIETIAFPRLKKTKETFLINYFMNEYVLICRLNSKYKGFTTEYIDFSFDGEII